MNDITYVTFLFVIILLFLILSIYHISKEYSPAVVIFFYFSFKLLLTY